jgi:hypothetical protein
MSIHQPFVSLISRVIDENRGRGIASAVVRLEQAYPALSGICMDTIRTVLHAVTRKSKHNKMIHVIRPRSS